MLKRIKQKLLNPSEADMNNILIILIGLGLIMLGIDSMLHEVTP